jgi:RNA polymerase sigma-70 factor (ECF subfamily)
MVTTAHTPVSEFPMGSIRDEPDESLALRAATDGAAMEELYLRYVEKVRRYCQLKVSNPHAVEDLVQDIFERMIAGLYKQRVTTFRPWLFTIAHNEIVSHYRSRRPHTALEDPDVYVDPAPTPEQIAIANSDRAFLRVYMARLPAAERQVVEMTMFGLTNGEISNLTGKTYSAVASLRHRALKRLRDMMDGKDPEGATS